MAPSPRGDPAVPEHVTHFNYHRPRTLAASKNRA